MASRDAGDPGDGRPNAPADQPTRGRTAGANRGRSRRIFGALLFVIALGALAVRAPVLGAGWPYPSYVDEHFTLRPAAQLIAGTTWDPGAYNYPTLTMYATVLGSAALDLRPGGGNLEQDAQSTVGQPITPSIHSTEMIIAGRLAVLLCSVGTVLASALLAARLRGRTAGVIAALATATLPALVTRGAVVIVDTPATFFATCSLLCASFLRTSPRAIWWAGAAGMTAGLAGASKYPVGVVVLAALTVIALEGGRPLRDRLRLSGVALVAGAGAAVVAAPTLLLRAREIYEELSRQSGIYADKSTTSFWQELVTGQEVGPVLLVLAVIGGFVLVRSAPTRHLVIGYGVFGVALLAQVARYPFQPFRNILPLLPFLAVAASVGIVGMVDALGKVVSMNRLARAGIAGALGIGLCSLMVSAGARYYVDTRVDITNTRVQAREWLRARVGPGDDVLFATELALLPSELARIPARVTEQSLAKVLTAGDLSSFEYVIVGDFPTAAEWRPALVDRQVATRFGEVPTLVHPRSYRAPQQIIRVFAGPGTQDPRKCFPLCG